MILLGCAVFPTAAANVALGNCAVAVAVVESASITLVTAIPVSYTHLTLPTKA